MNKLEVWQRGPLHNISGLLQPVAHALMQAEEELEELLIDFQDQHLWDRPANLASPAFHLQHLSGVLDRVFTYARNEPLTAFQLKQLIFISSASCSHSNCSSSSVSIFFKVLPCRGSVESIFFN